MTERLHFEHSKQIHFRALHLPSSRYRDGVLPHLFQISVLRKGIRAVFSNHPYKIAAYLYSPFSPFLHIAFVTTWQTIYLCMGMFIVHLHPYNIKSMKAIYWLLYLFIEFIDFVHCHIPKPRTFSGSKRLFNSYLLKEYTFL